MARFRFHKLAAIAVMAVSAAWVLTGEFSSVGSAARGPDETAPPPATEQASDSAPAAAVLKTVAYIEPPFIDHRRAIRLSGRTEADKSATLTTREGGVIEVLEVEQGQSVAEGDLILALETEGREVAQESAKAVLAQRRKEYEAAERLAAQGSLPKLQLDNARSALAGAQWQLEEIETEIERLRVTAPFAGVIDRVMVEKGGSVQQGTPVAELLQLDPIIATGEVSEHDLRFVRQGVAAEIRLVDGSVVEGAISFISRKANAQTRTFPVEVAIPNPDRAIPAGMTAEITLRTEPVRAVALPRSVVTLSANGDLGIRILKPDNVVGFVVIDLVDDMPGGLVLGGVPEDARIIVAGQDLVRVGEIVKAVAADPERVRELVGEVAAANR